VREPVGQAFSLPINQQPGKAAPHCSSVVAFLASGRISTFCAEYYRGPTPRATRMTSTRPSSPDKLPIAGMSPDQILALCEDMGQPRFRAAQILHALYRSPALDFSDITTLPKSFREELSQRAELLSSHIVEVVTSGDGTDKLLVELADAERIEAAMIPEAGRITFCLSSQVGCGMNCRFCASNGLGFVRNLTAAEIVEQALLICKRAMTDGREMAGLQGRSPHIVMMGIGEPLANYDNVIAAIRILNAPWGLNVGARRFTISTVGLPDAIRRLAREDLQINLAVSLHAPNNLIRNQIVPANEGIGIEKILAAARDFFKETRRQVTFEYVLIDGMNSDLATANELGRHLKGLHAAVNLIPLNPIENLDLRPPPPDHVRAFAAALRRADVNVTMRKRRGDDISAACGQLRRIRKS